MLAVLLVAAASIGRAVLGLPIKYILLAGIRALVQLTVVAVLIAQLERSGWLAMAFLLLMLGVASWTAAKRIGGSPFWIAALPIGAGTLPVAGLMVVTGVLPLHPLALVAVVGQLIGGSMTATNLAGRRLKQELALRHGEVEAGMALGLTLRSARSLVARPVAAEALIPALDQTRTVGTVTLPAISVATYLAEAGHMNR